MLPDPFDALPSPEIPSSSLRQHLQTQLTNIQRRYATLSTRITTLETEHRRELDSERKLILQRTAR